MTIGSWRFRLMRMPETEYVSLEYDRSLGGGGNWEGTGVIAYLDVFNERRMAVLPVLTLRFPAAGTSADLFANMMPLRTLTISGNTEAALASGDAPIITVLGGEYGAWLTSLFQGDENPMYVDENRNGIDDDFEIADAYLNRNTRDLKQAWRRHLIQVHAPTMVFDRPVPAVAKGKKDPQ